MECLPTIWGSSAILYTKTERHCIEEFTKGTVGNADESTHILVIILNGVTSFTLGVSLVHSGPGYE